MVPPLLEDLGESAAHLSGATGHPAIGHPDQISNRLIGRGDRLLLLRPRCDRETYHFGDGDLSAASDALDPLSGLCVKSQSQRRSHIANTHEFTVLRRVIQGNCGSQLLMADQMTWETQASVGLRQAPVRLGVHRHSLRSPFANRECGALKSEAHNHRFR